MKLKTAHIFLAAASLATLTVLAGCGTNNSGELSSPGYNVADLVSVPSIVSLAITPQVASGHVGQVVQLTAQGTLSNGQVANVSSQVTWSSSDPSLASVNSTGAVTAKLPGTVTITATRGTLTTSIQFTVNPFITRVFISNKGNNSIAVFDLNANGVVNPVHTISGANTQLTSPGQMAFLGQELFVANPGKGEVEVFNLQAEGNVAPLRHIKNPALTAGVTGIAINSNTNELFVLSGTNLSVFNPGDSGDNVTPKRTPISGATTTLVSTGDAQIALSGNSVLVPNVVTVLAFDQNQTGNTAPTKTLTGPAALLKKSTAVGVNSNTGDFFVSDQGNTPGAVFRFASAADTVTAPLQTIAEAPLLAPRGLLPVANNGSLWVVDTASVKLYPAAGAPPTRAFSSSALSEPQGIVITGSF